MNQNTAVLSNMFERFNDLNIRYCVMNNYSKLPEIISSDLDIVIERRTFRELDEILGDLANANHMEIIQKICHGYNKCAYILSPLMIRDRFRIQLDFFVDFCKNDYPYLIQNEIMLKNRQRYKNFFIPDPAIEILFSVIRRIIKGDINQAHIDYWQNLLPGETTKIKSFLKIVLGEELTESVMHALKFKDISTINRMTNAYRHKLRQYSIRNVTVMYLVMYYTHQLRRAFFRFLRPVGFSIVLIGPDGCGKSTIAQRLLQRTAGSFHGGRIEYWRPNLLPAMGALKIWNPSKEVTANPTPHDHPKQNTIKSFIRFFYYMADYVIGYAVKTYWAKVKKNMIIFDRFYYDFLVDLHRYRFNIPQWISRVFLPVIPSPDIVIYLDADPKLIHKRKQELSLKELQRQTLEYNKIIKWLPNSVIVKADRSVDDITNEITYLILLKKSRQTKKILKRRHRQCINSEE